MGYLQYDLNEQEKSGILKLVRYIEREIRQLDGSGSCGDGSFDSKQRDLEIKDLKLVAKIIKRMLV